MSASYNVISNVLHHVDADTGMCKEIVIEVGAEALQNYLKDLLSEIHQRPQKREFRIASTTTEFANALSKFFEMRSLVDEEAASPAASSLAARLLRIEEETERKYGHLKKDRRLLNKGSFLQFVFEGDDGLHYLGVKVEHQFFLDESDFSRRVGIGESHKIYKACKISFDEDGAVSSALVFDTNSSPSAYWWSDFWEMVEVRTDSYNTNIAISAVVKALGPLKKVAPSDYTVLRNASVAAFKRVGDMDFDAFVSEVIEGYELSEKAASSKFNEIVKKIRGLPAAKKFDSQFTLVPSSVSFKKLTLPLTGEISVTFNEDMSNIDDKIWASSTVDGKGVVVVEADKSALSRFKYKPMG